jgi:hypothetical protein
MATPEPESTPAAVEPDAFRRAMSRLPTGTVEEAGRFGVNVLAAEQAELAGSFSTKLESRRSGTASRGASAAAFPRSTGSSCGWGASSAMCSGAATT